LIGFYNHLNNGDYMPIDVANLAGTAVLTFSEEFDRFKTWDGASGWDTSWSYAPPEGTRGYNNELQWYIKAGYHPTVGVRPWQARGGVLSLAAQRTPATIAAAVKNAPYVSGMINSFHSFSLTYGYVEMRAQLPKGKGLWPAFWMLRKDKAKSSEIDIMEQIGQLPNTWYSTVHSFASGSIVSVRGTHTGVDTSAAMHTYGLNWTETVMEFYQDGVKYWETLTPPDAKAPFYVIANLAVGGTWPGVPDAATAFPAVMKIDYIRAYKARAVGPNPGTHSERDAPTPP
jgi:beta-glucanase (GH16 family)